jgi:hypothetical protein
MVGLISKVARGGWNWSIERWQAQWQAWPFVALAVLLLLTGLVTEQWSQIGAALVSLLPWFTFPLVIVVLALFRRNRLLQLLASIGVVASLLLTQLLLGQHISNADMLAGQRLFFTGLSTILLIIGMLGLALALARRYNLPLPPALRPSVGMNEREGTTHNGLLIMAAFAIACALIFLQAAH